MYNDDYINIDGNEIHRTAIIDPCVTLGKGNRIGPYAVIGGNAEVRNVRECKGRVVIGDNNTISEHVTIQRPVDAERVTYVGNGNIIMAHAHLGHDVMVCNNVEICTSTVLGGYVTVKDGARIKLHCVVRNRVTVGTGATVGMGSVVTKDVADGAVVYGNPAKPKA